MSVASEDLQTKISTSHTSASKDKPYHVLLIEDSHPDAVITESALKEADDGNQFWVIHTKRLATALKLIKRDKLDLVLLDLSLPDAKGLESIATIKKEAPDLPIVVLTGLDNPEVNEQALRLGAQDYLVKGHVSGNHFSQILRHSIQRQKIHNQLQLAFLNERFSADHDHLTGLPNRKFFVSQLENQISQSYRNNQILAMLFIDLDGFKLVNDSFGHQVGDVVLQAAAKRIQHTIRESDLVSRFAGDEFTVVLNNIAKPEDAARVANKLLNILTRPVRIEDKDVSVTASIGISVYPYDATERNDLINNADTAMYQSKELGKNQVSFFSEQMNLRSFEAKNLEKDIQRALKNDEFLVYYQPQMDLKTGEVVALQPLIRWNHPERGFIEAKDFIPQTEENGCIARVNQWLFEKTCEQIAEVQKNQGVEIPICFNFSNTQFFQTDFVDRVRKILSKNQIKPSAIRMLFRETGALKNPQRNVCLLEAMKRTGINLVLHDFGTGMMSIKYLKRLGVDQINISSQLIKKMADDEDEAALVHGIIQLAHHLNLKVSAQGVENESQLNQLKLSGCDYAQGFVFEKPVKLEEAAKLVNKPKENA